MKTMSVSQEHPSRGSGFRPVCHSLLHHHKGHIDFFLKIHLFIYFAALGLNCSMQDGHCIMWDLSLWCMGSLVVVSKLGSCGALA